MTTSNNTLLYSADNVSAATRYFPTTTGDVGIEMGEHTVATVGIIVSGGVTITIEGCMRRLDHPTDAGLTDAWVDITGQFVDLSTGLSGTTSFVDVSKILQANGLNVERIRVKTVTSDTSNSLDIWLRRM